MDILTLGLIVLSVILVGLLLFSKKRSSKIQRELTSLQAKYAKRTKQAKSLSSKAKHFEQLAERTQALTVHQLDELISTLKQEIRDWESQRDTIIQEADEYEQYVAELQQHVTALNDTIEMESFNLYEPKYGFATSERYAEALAAVRDQQKEMIRQKTATSIETNWSVDGSRKAGEKLANDSSKQLLRSFNTDCEVAVSRVTFSNVEAMEKRIQKSYDQLNTLNKSNGISLSDKYLKLKMTELHIAYEYQHKKAEEKELLKEAREQEREQAKLRKEMQAKKAVFEKDIQHYNNTVERIERQLHHSRDHEVIADLQRELAKLHKRIEAKEEAKAALDQQSTFTQAGYVYIISNIGAFGEDVVKIGVTRRLDPYERINELSSAAVPFKFDVHAMIFSHDAFALEKELHEHFDAYRVNKVNKRKEFFKIPVDEVQEVLRQHRNLTFDFQPVPPAEEFRESARISA